MSNQKMPSGKECVCSLFAVLLVLILHPFSMALTTYLKKYPGSFAVIAFVCWVVLWGYLFLVVTRKAGIWKTSEEEKV